MTAKEILIIEDDLRFRNTVKLALQDQGHTLFEAASAQEGIDKLIQFPNIKVILLDLKLKDSESGGQDFLERIKDKIQKYRIIILTGHEDRLVADMAKTYGVFNYLAKAAKSFTQSIRFTVNLAFKDIEREQLKDKNNFLIEIQSKINSDLQENVSTEQTLKALHNILNLICQSVNTLVGTYKCHIRIYNLKRGTFDLADFAGPSDAVKMIFEDPGRKGEFFSGEAAGKKKPLLFENLQNNKDFEIFKKRFLKDPSLPEETKKYLNTVQSAYIAPITTQMFDDETDAVFNMSSDSVSFFSEDKKEVIKEFVTQATIAITKAWQKDKKSETHQYYKGISKVLEDISKEIKGEDIKK